MIPTGQSQVRSLASVQSDDGADFSQSASSSAPHSIGSPMLHIIFILTLSSLEEQVSENWQLSKTSKAPWDIGGGFQLSKGTVPVIHAQNNSECTLMKLLCVFYSQRLLVSVTFVTIFRVLHSSNPAFILCTSNSYNGMFMAKITLSFFTIFSNI
jgi:hypothetical protein